MPNSDSPEILAQSPANDPAIPPHRHTRWPRILLWTAGSLLALTLLAAAAGVIWLRAAEMAALPVLDGDLHLAGLSAPVTVRRDAHGVPHIEAATEDDLFVAQGYVTAQDRLWQMDIFRRHAKGELAEILGPSLVQHDKAQRVLQFANTARRIYANLPWADRARLDDYARGVNLFIEQNRNSLPAEFRLLAYRPQPWTGADSIVVGLLMVEDLDTHWDTKLSRERISRDLRDEKLEADLYPVGSWRDHPPTGEVIDWSQPHPAPPGTNDDDDDNTQASAATPTISDGHVDFHRSGKGRSPGTRALKGHVFRRADTEPIEMTGFSPRGNANDSTNIPSGAKARACFAASAARLKSCPFKADGPIASEDTAALHALLGLPACEGCALGSNNWVIAGSRTASGKPLLSNDMHLGLTEPNIWFMADLSAPGFHAAGVTLPGMPFVIAGHNEHVAWGFTALYADVQDLYVEKLDGKGNYEGNDAAWRPLQVDRETIKVRGGKDVTLDVQLTEHGPLLNPILPKERRPIALKWTLYDPTLNAMPIYEMDVAANWTEFSAALAEWCWPTQNVVYSDDQGHIAYHAVGRVPYRFSGHALFSKPLPPDPLDMRFEWGIPVCHDGQMRCDVMTERMIYIPFDKMPSAVDPPSGFLATANSRVTSDETSRALFQQHGFLGSAGAYTTSGEEASALITLEWPSPYRAERIYKMLQGRDRLKPADMLAVQTDVYSEVDQEFGHRFAYAIDHTPGADDRLKKAADLMRSWDGRLTTDSAAASIVTQTRKALWPLILEPKLGKDAGDYHWAESSFAEEEIVMHANPAWLPPAYKNWDALLTEAVRKGMKDGKAPADVAEWTYGSWHVLDIEHPLARFLPIIGRVAGTGPEPLSGDTTTVKQAEGVHGPSQRFTIDWSNIDGATENIVLGESSDPFSPYFRDQWNDWYGGTTFALPFTTPAVAAQTRHTLRLLP
jgi:penicillin amidase